MELLGLPISEYHPVFLGFMLILIASLVFIAITIPLWFVLHRLLEPLDNVLLREPFFPRWDQPNWQVWPVSYLKTFTYVCLIAVPSVAMRKRFKGLKVVPKVARATKLLARAHFIMMCLGAIMFFVYFGYAAFFMFIYPLLFGTSCC